MDWLAKYWWILVLVFLVGVLLNVIKDLKRIDHKKFLANKPELPRIAILTISGTMKKTGRRKISRKSNRITCRTGIAIRHGPHRRALRRANAAFVRHPAQSAPAPSAHAATPAELYGLKCVAGRTVRHRWLFLPAALSAPVMAMRCIAVNVQAT